MRKPRIQDIANASHFSVSTISRALNNSPLISEETRVEVQKIALSMGYYDQQQPVLRRSDSSELTLGFCVNDISNPICPTIIEGVLSLAQTHNFKLVTMDSRNSEEIEEENLEYFLTMQVDGVLLLPVNMSPSSSEKQSSYPHPVVHICNTYPPGTTNFVGIDYTNATLKATEYLIQLGHQRIAFIGSAPRFATREEGVRMAMENYQLQISTQDFYPGPPNYETGYFIMESLLQDKKDYTAIIAANDYLALGAVNCIHRYGYQIPDDFSVVGFDNVLLSGHSSINLTTVNQPAFEIGVKATEILCKKIKVPSKKNLYYLLESSFIIRGSCQSLWKAML